MRWLIVYNLTKSTSVVRGGEGVLSTAFFGCVLLPFDEQSAEQLRETLQQ